MKNSLILFLLLTSVSAFAQPGRLDPGFGTGGKLTTDFEGRSDQAQAVFLFPDGRIFVGGSMLNASGMDTNFGMAIYRPDGRLDSSFSGDGRSTISLGGRDEMKAAALQPDGKFLLAGNRFLNGKSSLSVVRYLPNASFDNGFGTFFGTTQIILGPTSIEMEAMTLLPDGKFVVAGTIYATGGSDMMLFGFQANGRPDSSFGVNGLVTTDFFGEDDAAYVIAQLPDGKLLVAGRTYDTAATLNENFALARYLPDGDLDPTFGTGGKVTVKFTGFIEWASGMAVLPDGKILLTGHTQVNGFLAFALTRLNPDGSLDATYGNNGKITHSIPGYANASSLAIQPDGKAIIGGFNSGPFLLARFTTGGALDSTFTDGVSQPAGLVQTNFGTSFSEVSALAMYPEGTLLAVGTNGNDFAVARYLTDGNTRIDPGSGLSAAMRLFPHPFETEATLELTLQEARVVDLHLLDATGRQVADLGTHLLTAGTHELALDFPGGLPSGMYVLHAQTETGSAWLKIRK